MIYTTAARPRSYVRQVTDLLEKGRPNGGRSLFTGPAIRQQGQATDVKVSIGIGSMLNSFVALSSSRLRLLAPLTFLLNLCHKRGVSLFILHC